ncbi:MAG TPA: CpsB/CapC family capsule biosynthesis tyrosine phosphatase [Chitinophagaceae bacterium]|nr:CpsB/CapC family capsule biosynthesis tyrosine phosphatase [Chitinophagaceae bacterium]
MFDFFRKKKATKLYDLSFLKADMHSHLIPGIDDGAKEFEDSMQMIRSLQELGIHKLVTTPHIMRDYYPNTAETIHEGLELLKNRLKAEKISLEIIAAAEYFIDEHFEKLLNSRELLPITGNQVLVEISFMGAPYNLHGILFDMQAKGYQPILAHPERYGFYTHDLDQFRRLRELGCKLQVNLNSFSGYYGKAAKETALLLLREKLVDYAGTDMHHGKHIEALFKLLQMPEEMELLSGYEKWGNWDI